MSNDTFAVLRIALFFSSVSSILCFFTYKILKKRLNLSSKNNIRLGFGILFIFLLLVIGPIHYRTEKPDPADFFSYALQTTQYFLMGWIGVLFIIFSIVEFFHVLFRAFDPQKRIFLTTGVTKGIITAATLSTGVGFYKAKIGPEVVPVILTVPSLPLEFDGLKIAQITDVHIGPLLHLDFLESVVAKIQSIQPDLIFITGDLVDGSVDQLKRHLEPLKKLIAQHGVYFVTGNHEYYSGAEDWIAFIESIGIHVFKNSNVVISRPSADLSNGALSKILISGVFDFQAERMMPHHKTDAHKAAETIEAVSTKLLLAHNPYSIVEAAQAGFDVQFSGHTHAGQFYPFAWITKLLLKHVEGHYVINDKTQLYVSRGTGYWGPANRLGKPAEITSFSLRKG